MLLTRSRDRLILVAIAGAAGVLGAEAVSTNQPAGGRGAARGDLTWQACMAAACEHNPDILAAQFNVKKASSSAQAAAGQRYPTASLESSLMRSEDGASEGGAAGLSSTGSQMQDDETSVSLVGRYDLYTGGRVTAEVRSANAARRQADATFDATRHEVLCELRRAFASLLYAQELIALSESIAKQRETNLGLVQLRFEGGIEHKGSYLFSRALHEESLMEIRQAERTRRTAQLELGRLMGRPADAGFRALGTLEAAWGVSSTNWDERVLSHPASRAKEAELDMAVEGVAKARSKFRPSLALVGSSSVYSKEVDLDTYRWKVALVMSLPLFTGWQNENELAASEAGLRMAGESLRSTQDRLRAQMETSLSLLLDARERVQAQRTLLSAVTIRAEIARQQFNSGLLRFENWDLIENDSIIKQKQMLAALRDALYADTDLRRALGPGDLP
jgi:outer membrane protein TolC